VDRPAESADLACQCINVDQEAALEQVRWTGPGGGSTDGKVDLLTSSCPIRSVAERTFQSVAAHLPASLGRVALKIALVLGSYFHLCDCFKFCVSLHCRCPANLMRRRCSALIPPLQLRPRNYCPMTGLNTTIRMPKVRNMNPTTMSAKARTPSFRRKRGPRPFEEEEARHS
jgi:hypothetical protein